MKSKKLKIAFFGLEDSFDFEHIGGMDSLTRLLAKQLSKIGDEVHFVHYGANDDKGFLMESNIYLRDFMGMKDAFEYLETTKFDHVVSIYIRPADRFHFAQFRKKNSSSIKFHHIYSIWAESRLKRELLFVESRLFPYNGYLFCLSPRFYRYVSEWSERTAMLWPPVADYYFCTQYDKLNDGRLRITYAGRVDPEKGANAAIEVFRRFAGRSDIEIKLSGYAWSHKPETMKLHNSLLNEPYIIYEPVEFQKWSPEVDEKLVQLLRRTDILLLPYRYLSSTIDTPLLLLEGMASLCAIITPPLGDLHETYGVSDFNLSGGWNTDIVVELIEKAIPHLSKERERLLQQNASLNFDIKSVTENFRRLLFESTCF